MTEEELMWLINTNFGGENMCYTYFTTTDIANAINLSLFNIASLLPRDRLNLPNLIVTADLALDNDSYPLPDDFMKIADLWVEESDGTTTEPVLVRPLLFFNLKRQSTVKTSKPYATVTANRVYLYTGGDLPATVKLQYIPRPQTITDLPIEYHYAAAYYAMYLLAKKVRGLWQGDPELLYQQYMEALRIAMRDYSVDGFKDKDFMSTYDIIDQSDYLT